MGSSGDAATVELVGGPADGERFWSDASRYVIVIPWAAGGALQEARYVRTDRTTTAGLRVYTFTYGRCD